MKFASSPWFVLRVLTTFGLLACDRCDSDEARPEAPANEAPAPAVPSAAVETDERPRVKHLALLPHLADVYSQGLFISFGNAGRNKYTMGNWGSGFGTDVQRGAERYTPMSEVGRLFFPVDAVQPLTLRMRVRNVGGGPMLAFVGETEITIPPIEVGDFQTVVVNIPASALRSGENSLLLRGPETRVVAGFQTSFDVASIHLAESEPSPSWSAPWTTPLPMVDSAGQSTDGIRIDSGDHWSWFVEVPNVSGREAELAFEIASVADGNAAVDVEISVDGEEGETTRVTTPRTWELHRQSLARFAGKMVRVRLRANSDIKLAHAQLNLVGDAPTATLPNLQGVIFLTIDTLRADALRVYNPQSRVTTPALDSLAAQAVVFERAQSPENWTKPAVASMLTSLFPVTHGAKNDASRVPESAILLPQVFQDAGFATAGFIANGYVSDAFGFGRGWDEYTNYIREERSTLAQNVFDDAWRWVDAHKSERFFLYIQTIDPHVPYDPPEQFLRAYDPEDYDGPIQNRRTAQILEEAKRRPPAIQLADRDRARLRALYDGEVSYHDAHLGRFIDSLRTAELLDKVLFVITADHGEEFEDHDGFGHGHTVYQELIHVPLIVRMPATAPARIPQVVSTMGIAPMVLEATNVPVPASFEGTSLLPYVRGDVQEGPWVAFSDFQENRRVVRAQDRKIILRQNLGTTTFDLSRDPGELHEGTGNDAPIAFRSLRILLGQQLGAGDRRSWLSAASERRERGATPEAAMTPELCAQLVALGYVECQEQLRRNDDR